jgi:hypothetical protein
MRIVPILLTLVLIVAFGIAEGEWTNRWSSSDPTEQAVAKLAGIPASFGAWISEDTPIDPRQVKQAEISGYVKRRYKCSTGEEVSVLVVCGRPGPTSVHTPDICFPASGYNLAAPAERQSMSAPTLAHPADFWVARFQKSGDLALPLQTCWSWNAAGTWMAPDQPRFEFGRYSFLYKLYVTHLVVPANDSQASDPSAAFLAEFLPELQKCLFPGT